MVAIASATVFEAQDENTYIELNIQNASASTLNTESKWDDEKTIAENS